ncbi:MAG: prolyl oligopeptidase family serine peptidase [Bryobacterales bacterium]|nr:prolyl oligopeptidase family serine peptidase [Bryobacterales bacterium]
MRPMIRLLLLRLLADPAFPQTARVTEALGKTTGGLRYLPTAGAWRGRRHWRLREDTKNHGPRWAVERLLPRRRHALRTLGVPTELVVYAGEGHMFVMAGNRVDYQDRTVAWFQKYLSR